jgi:hypothetical protein
LKESVLRLATELLDKLLNKRELTMATYPNTLGDHQELHSVEKSLKRKDFLNRLVNAPITIISVAILTAIFLVCAR